MRVNFLRDITSRLINSKTWTIFSLCIGAGLLMCVISAMGWLEFVEVRTLYTRMYIQSKLSLRKKVPDSSVAVIQIDERSERKWDAWPWPHGMFTPVVYLLNRAGASSVGLLVWFNREGDDRELADSLRDNPVFLVKPYVSAPSGRKAIPQIELWSDLPSLLQEVAKGASFAYSNLDTEEGLYKVQLLAQKDETNYYSLDLWLICQHLGINVENLSDEIQLKESFWHGKYLQIQRPDGTILKIPMDNSGRLLVNFFTTPPVYDSYTDVLERDGREPARNIEKYQNKIVLVGATTEKWAVKTSFGPLTELDLHVYAINTILSDAFVTRLNKPMNLGYILLMCLAFALVVNGLDKKIRRGKFLWAIISCFGVHTLIVVISCMAGFWVDWFNPTGAILLCGGTTAMASFHLDLRRAYHQLRTMQAREIALEGVTGLALEIVDVSHRARRMSNIPFQTRLRLHTSIVQHLHEHLVSPPEAEKLLSTVVREALKQAFKNRCEGFADNLEGIMHQIQDMPEGKEYSIEVTGYIGINCYLLNPNPINVRKPHMLQAVLKCIIDNALKSMIKLRGEDQSANAKLCITSCVSDNDYTITVVDSGGSFNQKTIELLQKPQKDLLTWMKNQLEGIEQAENGVYAQESYESLPVGLGLLLSRLILTELYSGDLNINNQPKSVTVKCKKI